MKTIIFFTLIILLLGGLSLFPQVYVQAAGISISPVTFELTANPGDVLINKIRVRNPTESTIAVKMEVEDFKPVGELGEVIVTPEEEITYSLKQWVKTEPTEFTLKPNEQKFVDFIINVPDNAEPGGKYGSVLASTMGAIGPGITGVAVAQKIGALVLLTISGEITESLVVKEFSAPEFLEYGPVPFMIRFENTGTVHVRPRGFVTITDWRGKKVADVEFPQQNVIPRATRKISAPWDKKWLFGRYTATLVGNYGTGNLPIEPPVILFWVFPWKLALGVFLGLMLMTIYFIKTRKRWRLALRVLIKGEQ
jgi:hypothetical protein